MSETKKHDVALSFLMGDAELASEIQSRLSPHLDVFAFFERQQEIAGADGLEVFSQTFRNNSRLVVVLYREGWGDTDWTNVEHEAIQERHLKERVDWLLFVTLERDETLPGWLPETRVRFSFPDYGLEQLVGTIKYRVEQLGGHLKVESVADRAARIAQETQNREESERLLAEEGYGACTQEVDGLYERLCEKANSIGERTPSLGLQAGNDPRECVLATPRASIVVLYHPTALPTGPTLVVREWQGKKMLPEQKRSRIYLEDPKHLRDHKFRFSHRKDLGWCWEPYGDDGDTLPTQAMEDNILTMLLDLRERIEKENPHPADDW